MIFVSLNFIPSSLKWFVCLGLGQLIDTVGGGDPWVTGYFHGEGEKAGDAKEEFRLASEDPHPTLGTAQELGCSLVTSC